MVIVEGPEGIEAIVASVLPWKILIQLRDKQASGRTLFERAVALRGIEGARVVVNDRIDVALAAGLDGVHLPENGMSVADARRLLGDSSLVGASTHSVDRAIEQAEAGADLLTIGPVWATPGHGVPRGLDLVERAAGALAARGLDRRTRLFALGGVDSPERAREAVAAGAWGVAVIRAAPHAAALLAAMGGGVSQGNEPQ
jgi:thiamine-phosphate pyrophosphorylase